MAPCRRIDLSSCLFVTLTAPCRRIDLSSCLFVTLTARCRHIDLSACLFVTLTVPCHHTDLSSCLFVTLTVPCHHTDLPSCLFVTLTVPCHHTDLSLMSVRTKVVVVAVRELLFLVTSMICVRIRGRGSEFRLIQRSDHNGFVVLFIRYLSHKHKTYKHSL